MKQAIIYQPDEKAFRQLLELMQSLGIREKRIEEKELSLPIGSLLGLPGLFPAEKESIPGSYAAVPPLTVLSGFTGEDLDAFLEARKNSGLYGLGFLAVVTLDNIGWSMRALGRELILEHEAIKKSKKPE